MSKRIALLERGARAPGAPAVVLIHAEGFDPDSVIGADGVDCHRGDGEALGDFLARLDAQVRADCGRALPLVTFARYRVDDLPDRPAVASDDPLIIPT
jgi:hypothetical protein